LQFTLFDVIFVGDFSGTNYPRFLYIFLRSAPLFPQDKSSLFFFLPLFSSHSTTFHHLSNYSAIMHIVSFANHKGGVGKTTTAANVGHALAEKFKLRTLLIDMDPQANLTSHFGIYKRPQHSTYELLRGAASVAECVMPITDTLSLLPSSLDLTNIESELQGTTGREFVLREALDDWSGLKNFDCVLIDTPPSLGVLTVNAFTASTDVCVVVQTEFFALQGLAKLQEIITIVQKRTNPKLSLTGVIATMFDRRKGMHCEALQALETRFPDELFSVQISESIALVEASSAGKSIFDYKPSSRSAEQYTELARLITERW
jgi:chromosome partitioning protein